MPTEIKLDDAAVEKSTLVINLRFTDEDDQAITPTAAYWTLTDLDGTVINSRSGVTISSLATNVNVVLQGDDLQLTGSGTDAEYREFSINATYNSSYGSGLPLRDKLKFPIKNIEAVS